MDILVWNEEKQKWIETISPLELTHLPDKNKKIKFEIKEYDH